MFLSLDRSLVLISAFRQQLIRVKSKQLGNSCCKLFKFHCRCLYIYKSHFAMKADIFFSQYGFFSLFILNRIILFLLTVNLLSIFIYNYFLFYSNKRERTKNKDKTHGIYISKFNNNNNINIRKKEGECK